MTRQQFIDQWKHEFGGMVSEAAATSRHHADLCIMLRTAFAKIDKSLGQIFDQLTPAVPAAETPGPRPSANGTAHHPPARRA